MPGPEVAEVPALGALLVSMAAALAWAASTGALQIWRRSLGKLLIYMADTLDKASVNVGLKTIHIFRPLSKLLRAMVHTVDHYLGEAVEWSGNAAAVFFHFFLSINLWMAREIADLARDTLHALDSSATTTINRVTKVVTHTVVKPITKTVTVVGKVSTTGLARLSHQLDVLRKQVAHAVAVSAGAIAAPWPRIRGLERRATNQAKRLSRLEKATIGALGTALVWTALRRLGVKWLRCSNTKKTGERLCGMDPSLLDSLLLGTLLVSSRQSVVTFAEAMLDAEGEMVGVLERMISELGDLTG